MRIGLVGGTGREGRGLAQRWARAGHAIAVGSRQAERGRACAAELGVSGGDNASAVAGAEVVVVCVPYTAHAETFAQLAGQLSGQVVIDITVPLRPPRVREVHLPAGQAAVLEAQELLGPDVKLVAALHHVSSAHLSELDASIDCDVLVCSDHDRARQITIGLIADLGLRGLDAGPLRNAIALESLTPVLLYLNRRYKSSGAGLRITGLPDALD
jgi:8-hydroxy-5-deazaflavin:NADPH oxidoreductase